MPGEKGENVKSVIHSARLVSGGRITTDAWVAFEAGVITAVSTGSDWRHLDARPDDVTDASGSWLVPGFIDLHCHGGGGGAFDDGVAASVRALEVHGAHGTTRLVMSLVTASQTDLERRLGVVAELAATNPRFLGAHLEGPFLRHSYRGAHDPELVRAPDRAALERLLVAGKGFIRQVTLAPELAGADGLISELVGAGVVAAVGHCAATFDESLAAFDAGASVLTHAFNAMPGIHHREPGPVVAALRSAHVTLELINDGVHIHPEIVRFAFENAPARIALISDAMAATDAPDGNYLLGSLPVLVTEGIARLADERTIAGSTLTLDKSLRRGVFDVGLPIVSVVTALTETPARTIGRSHDLGRLDVGYIADAVILDSQLCVKSVYAAGEKLSASLS
ncbi:MAG: N-acetylglucosamine-6-phosphate deacetylase [Microbacteriaceae bacterium]|nr:N-acetylglucosamine-6-phosphate deacetylase [Microbacteriaceae bacterium]